MSMGRVGHRGQVVCLSLSLSVIHRAGDRHLDCGPCN